MTNRPSRPRSISLLVGLLVLLAVLQIARAVALSEQSALLLSLQVKPDPRIRLFAALAWMATFWAAALLVWYKKPISRWLAPVLIALYAMYEMAFLALFAQVQIGQQRWILYGVMSIAVVLYAYWALNSSAADAYYGEENSLPGP